MKWFEVMLQGYGWDKTELVKAQSQQEVVEYLITNFSYLEDQIVNIKEVIL